MSSLRTRILVSHVGQVSLILVGFSAALYAVVDWRLMSEIDAGLADALRYAATRVQIDDGDEIEFKFQEKEYPESLVWRMALYDGETLARSREFPALEGLPAPEELPAPIATESGDALAVLWNTVDAAGEGPYRVAQRRLTVGARPRRYEVEWSQSNRQVVVEEKPPKPAKNEFGVVATVATSLAPREKTLASLLRILAVAVAVALLVSVLGGIGLARRILRPVSGLASAVEGIGPASLSARLEPTGSGDEIDRLAVLMNGMLGRIESAFQREKRFTSDAGHELRSPLTALRGEIEVALRKERSGEEYATVLRSCLGDIERLERLSTGLLLLARADSGQFRSAAADDIDLERAVSSVLAEVPRDEGRVELAVEAGAEGVRVRGVASLLEVLVRNLVENALRHGAPPVRVALETTRTHVVLSVRDSGPGVPPDEIEQVFDRFYRVDRARSRRTGGTGLGLAIARAITEAHGGAITARNVAGGGACFSVTLPAVERSSARASPTTPRDRIARPSSV